MRERLRKKEDGERMLLRERLWKIVKDKLWKKEWTTDYEDYEDYEGTSTRGCNDASQILQRLK